MKSKCIIFFVAIFSIIFSGCSINKETLPNINLSQNTSHLNVGFIDNGIKLNLSELRILKNLTRNIEVFDLQRKKDYFNEDMFLNVTITNTGKDVMGCKRIFYKIEHFNENFVNLYTLLGKDCILNNEDSLSFLVPIDKFQNKPERTAYTVTIRSNDKSKTKTVHNDIYVISYDVKFEVLINADNIIGYQKLADKSNYVYNIVNPSNLSNLTTYNFYEDNSLLYQDVPLPYDLKTSISGEIDTGKLVVHNFKTPNTDVMVSTNIYQISFWIT